MNIILLSLISTVVFGIIDAIFFLLFEETVQHKLAKFKMFDMNISELLTGALSASAAIFVASNIRINIQEEFFLFNHPLLDVSGILLGTLVVITNYLFYEKFLRKYLTLFKNTFQKSVAKH